MSSSFSPRTPDPDFPAEGAEVGSLLLEEIRRAISSRLTAHHQRVSAMSQKLALHLGLTPAEAAEIGSAGSLHDIGMALLPDELLDHRGPLSMREKQLLNQHSSWGGSILDMAGGLGLSAVVALQHHERWDGSGYPFGLAGEEICLAARIVAICAVYDALRNPRPGKAPLDHERAVRVLREGDDLSHAIAFDPAILETFERFGGEFRDIVDGDGGRALAA